MLGGRPGVAALARERVRRSPTDRWRTLTEPNSGTSFTASREEPLGL
jgi:hypothetical protein